MNQQQRRPVSPVTVSALALVVALAAFGAAFWYLDGMTYLDRYLAGVETTDSEAPAPKRPRVDRDTDDASKVPTDTLSLPAGMSRDFALRVWQEQLDSQATISRLVEGRVREMAITKVVTSSADTTLHVSVTFTDDSRANGVIGFHKVGKSWYFAYLSGRSTPGATGYAASIGVGDGSAPQGALPDLASVDYGLLNTIIIQQAASASIIEEYITGHVMGIDVGKPRKGSGTVTIPIVMREDHENGYADLILIESPSPDGPRWFIARFNKTKSEPL